MKMTTLDETSEYKIENIVRDIEDVNISMREILKKYNLTTYKYYKIINEFGITNETNVKRGPMNPTGPKETRFKKMLRGDVVEVNGVEEKFDLEEFKKDSKDGMKLSGLMDKYKLTLYQVREIRKKYDLKVK
jgi:Mor family transcriptional regulator